MKAVTAGIQIDRIAGELEHILLLPKPLDNTDWIKYKDAVHMYLQFLNAWSEFVINKIFDRKIMYECACRSLDNINALLVPLLNNNVSTVSKQQIRHYQKAYSILVRRYAK